MLNHEKIKIKNFIQKIKKKIFGLSLVTNTMTQVFYVCIYMYIYIQILFEIEYFEI